MTDRSVRAVRLGTSTQVDNGGDPITNLECSHPRCMQKPQRRYTFPIPLCSRHMVQVLARAVEVTEDAKREYVQKNGGVQIAPRSSENLARHAPLVYYVQFGDRIKIGTTTNLQMRLANVPHDRVLATEPGDRFVEQNRHRQFATDRISKEWFSPSDRLLKHIDTLNKHA